MLRKSNFLLLLVILGLTQSLLSQEEILKSYVDTTSNKEFCFYPSTLRMINITQNEDYNAMVEEIDKLLIYRLDSTARSDRSYLTVLEAYQEEGFEEYAKMYGGETNMHIYGKTGQSNEFVGVFSSKDQLLAFYLIGTINWLKIPSLIQNFKQDDMINIFDF
jgi:hypothetical protein